MNIATRMKFKERLVIGGVGLFFTTLIILEYDVLKELAVKPPKIHIESEDNPGANSQNEHHFQAAAALPLADSNQILEEILDDVGAHLALIRKKLSLDENNGHHSVTDFPNSHDVIQQLVTNSTFIQKYSSVFIKVGELLEEKDKVKSRDSGHNAKQIEASNHDAEAAVGEQDTGNVEPEVIYSYSKSPYHRVYIDNTTISQLKKPNGYDKRKGIDFDLPEQVFYKLKDVLETSRKATANKRNKPDTLDVYQDNGRLLPHEKWFNNINQYELYPKRKTNMAGLLKQLEQSVVSEATVHKDNNVQLRLQITFSDGLRAIFKPMRFGREQETIPDQYYFSDFERHNAEIAAFHLDRLLGFRRAPVVAGRRVHIIEEIKHATVEDNLRKDILVSPSGNWCYRGDERCQYCENRHLICSHGPNPYMFEGAMITNFPKEVKRDLWEHPWKRSYKAREAAEWEHDHRYCAKVKASDPVYRSGRRLLDLMDMAVLDFLMGNMDRSDYETMPLFGNQSFIIHTNNAKGFGNSKEDELTCLAPIKQCCMIRKSTLKTLMGFYEGPQHLSQALRHSLESDSVSPVLLETHLSALDRRVKIILQTIFDCISARKVFQSVVIDDGL